MDSLLPIGSVVTLENASAGIEMMVTGYYPVDQEAEEMFEYSGVLYPQGILGENSFFLFNSADIKEVRFIGFSDEEGEAVREALPLLLEKIATREEVQ